MKVSSTFLEVFHTRVISIMQHEIKRRFDFRWETLDVIIGGKSTIDSRDGFFIRDAQEARDFIGHYGFDLQNPIEYAEVFGHYHESINFIRRYFLKPDNPDGLKIEVPRKILELTKIEDLFLLASYHYPGQKQDEAGKNLRNWSCAILKVMHTLAHMDQDIRAPYFPDIQKQILDRFYKHIYRDEKGCLFLGENAQDPLRVNLVNFETKPKKSRDSTLMKLLHKSENAAEDIFDRVGIRFITESKVGVLQVVRYLKARMVVMAPNIKPSRSRNTLIDIEKFKITLNEVLAVFVHEGGTESDLIKKLESLIVDPETGLTANALSETNRHSSQSYRSIQFTGRQLIKLKNPLYKELKELKAKIKHQSLPDSVSALIEKIDLKYLQGEITFFFPYEVQLVDEMSHRENEEGRAAHKEYKKAQQQAAMKRVMGVFAET